MTTERPPLPIFVIVAVILSAVVGAWIPLDAQPIYSVLGAVMNEPTGALFGHAIIAAVIGGGLVSIAMRRRVLPLPQVPLLIPLAFMLLAVMASILWSEYRHLTLAGIVEWLVYGLAFCLTVGTVGRGSGVRATMTAITVTVSIMAFYGILEWLRNAQGGNPSWRIFAHTLNPNVAAGYFAIGAMTAFGLMRPKKAFENVLLGIAIFICLSAIFFTGSKGGFLATLGAGLFLAVWRLAMNVKQGWPVAAAVVGLFMAAFVVNGFALKAYSPKGEGQSRLAQAGQSQDQSAGFRQLLWRGSIELIKERPQGYGQGTYRFYSAKPGLTTQTHLSHNSYLQLAVEAGALALVAFLAFLGLLAHKVFVGTRSQPSETQALKAGVVAAIATVLLRSVIDSDLHVFGVGIIFFVLCGLAVQLATDSSAPEFLHPGLRNWLTVGGVVFPMALLYFGVVDLRHGLFLTPKQQSSAESVKTELGSLVSFAPIDARVAFTNFRYGAALGDPPVEQAVKLLRAIDLGPSVAMYRAMARLAAETKTHGDPNKYLDRGLELDPNNLLALKLKVELNRESNPDRATEAAQRLVKVEETPYFKVRSLPDLIATETFWGRIFLSERLTGEERQAMLKPAILGYQEYAKVTVPQVITFAKGGLDYGGITSDQAKENLEHGLRAIEAYGEGDPEVLNAKSALEAGLASLASLSQ